MSRVQKESCPICWRDFTAQTEPLLISCGHSFCSDCVTSISNRCPVCRGRVQMSYKIVKNFSLLSQLDKIDEYFSKEGQPQTQEQPDQSPQVEEIEEQPILIPARLKPRRKPNVIKTQGKSTTIRLMQGEEGRCNGITLRFK